MCVCFVLFCFFFFLLFLVLVLVPVPVPAPVPVPVLAPLLFLFLLLLRNKNGNRSSCSFSCSCSCSCSSSVFVFLFLFVFDCFVTNIMDLRVYFSHPLRSAKVMLPLRAPSRAYDKSNKESASARDCTRLRVHHASLWRNAIKQRTETSCNIYNHLPCIST